MLDTLVEHIFARTQLVTDKPAICFELDTLRIPRASKVSFYFRMFEKWEKFIVSKKL